MSCVQQIELAVAAYGKAAKTLGSRGKSRSPIEVPLGNLRKLSRVRIELCFVAVQQFAERRPRSFVMRNTIPLLVPSEFGEELRNVLQQFVAFCRGRPRMALRNFLRGAHSPSLAVYVQRGNRAVREQSQRKN